ncbi:MAG: MotA/TolQ/ExbB proton channel family protein [Planctomycetes bacterium]|nr:MotA/TolQ/ExbB proton channel family protein [Planctomycetota bacterium]
MDIASLIGLVIGGLCLGMVFFEVSHGHLAMFYSFEGVLMVGGGSMSVIFIAMPMDKIMHAGGYIKKFMFYKAKSPLVIVKLLSQLADKARRDGILALESDIAALQDEKFLAAGLRMAIDGMDPGNIEALMRMEIMSMRERHKAGKKFFELIKSYGPGWALVGTLVGQIGMFGNLEGAEIGKLGHMLAIAVCATMYGTVVANALAGPVADKLGMRSAEEILNREMMMQGVLSIQMGDNPRTTMDKMQAFLPGAQREALRKAA